MVDQRRREAQIGAIVDHEVAEMKSEIPGNVH